MRTLALAVAAALVPASAAAQLAPRSLAVDVGIARLVGEDALLRAPFGVAASWWIADDVDLVARVGWAAVPRTEVRAADALVDATAGVRHVFGHRDLRPALVAELGGASCGDAYGARVRGGVALDAFVARDLAAGLGVAAGVFLPFTGGRPSALDVALSLHVEAFF